VRLLTFCLRNLFRRKTRTCLCIIGVALATMFVIAVGSTSMRYVTVVRELNVLFSEKVMVVSENAIVVQAVPIGGGLLPENYTVKRLWKVDGVEDVVPVLFVTPVGIGDTIQLVPVNFTMGIPVGKWTAVIGPTPLRGNVGHFPSDESEVVVGCSLADQCNWTVGSSIVVNGYRLNVSGVLDSKVALIARSLVMPLKLAQKVYGYPGSVNIIAVAPADGVSEADLADRIKGNVSHVKALTEEERNDVVEPVLAELGTWIMGIQTVVFVLSLILVMTVMMMSVSERRRDFATLDAVGAPLSYVFRVVVFEALLIGVFGGVLGVVCGSILAVVLASLYTNIPLSLFFPSLFDVVPPLYMVEVFSGVVIVCCAGGLVPALNAVRVRVAEVLRAEY